MKISILILCFFSTLALLATDQKPPQYSKYEYAQALTHEISPHRRVIPLEGVIPGFHQLHLELVVSPSGDVLEATPTGGERELKFWPKVKAEVMAWKFTPFKKHRKPIAVEITEYLNLVPPERFPTTHVTAPVISKDSKIAITLERTECYGRCPSYIVTLSNEGIVFEGRKFSTLGKHNDKINIKDVRRLAQKFIDADFYSMEGEYADLVTDFPTDILSITIDGQKKEVVDYVGEWVGMPAVIKELENEVDTLGGTSRWVTRK